MDGNLKPLLDLWDFDDPANSERRFREAEKEGIADGATGYAWEARTQAARALGLRRHFEEADADLNEVEQHIEGFGPRLRIRYFLERGRVRNSSGEKKRAIPLLEEALRLAEQAHEEFLAVDAAHMLGIAEEPEKALEWNLKALEMARIAKDEKAKNWQGSLLNNLAWTYHARGDFARALTLFEDALAFRKKQGKAGPIRIAKWCIAKSKRSLGKTEEALKEQLELAKDPEAANDGYVQEEIGECLLALGKAGESKEHFVRAYEALSQDPWLSANEPERLTRMKELSS